MAKSRELGMCTFDAALFDLYNDGSIQLRRSDPQCRFRERAAPQPQAEEQAREPIPSGFMSLELRANTQPAELAEREHDKLQQQHARRGGASRRRNCRRCATGSDWQACQPARARTAAADRGPLAPACAGDVRSGKPRVSATRERAVVVHGCARYLAAHRPEREESRCRSRAFGSWLARCARLLSRSRWRSCPLPRRKDRPCWGSTTATRAGRWIRSALWRPGRRKKYAVVNLFTDWCAAEDARQPLQPAAPRHLG